MAASTSSVMETDDDPYVELCGIRGTELVKWSQIKDIKTLVVRCTTCTKQINHLDYHQVKRHYRLKVIVCKECFEFYGTDEFSKDENGNYNYCTWCGNGGKLFLCDFCPYVFCVNCIRRNFGRSEVTEMQKDGWKCCICDTSKIQAKVAYCDLITKFSNDLNKKTEDRSQTSKEHDKTKLVSETWVQDAFSRTENSCKTLQKKLNKLKNLEVSRSKSLKHVIKKMEEVVSRHKSELGGILKGLSEQYSNYVKMKQAEEESKIKNENGFVEIDISEEATDVIEVKDQNIKTQTKENGLDAKPEVSMKEEDTGSVKNEVTDSIKQESDIELAAKMDILKDSSEENEDIDLTNTSQESKNRSFTVTAEVHSSELQNGSGLKEVAKAKKSISQIKKPLNVSTKNCAIKESSISSLSSASDSDSFKKSRVAQKKSLSKKAKEKAAEIDYEKDDKLRSIPSVILEPCDSLLNGQTTIKVPAIFIVEELDKAINNLTKNPEISRKYKEKKSIAKKSTSKKAMSKKKVDYSSSSITFSSESEDGEEKQEKIVAPEQTANEDAEEQAKKEILGSSDDSSLQISSDSEEEKKKKSKKKTTKANSDSSDDFVPKKKKKVDKLLSKRLLSDDETTKGNKSKKASEKKKKRKLLTSDEDENKTKSAKSDSTTTSDSDDSDKPKRKRRKRIKKPASSSSEDNEGKKDDKDKETPKKGRKDIKKIISKKDLQESTKEAQQAEKERKKRIEEKQKLYNVITEKVKDGEEVITKKLVLEVDSTSKEELVEIHPDLIEKLKPHQVNGVKFMWECTIESLKELEKGPGSGCILAHCMGLGKTLQVITFLHTCLTNKLVQKHIKTAMVVCPYNTVLNWSKEVEMWLSKVDSEEILLHEMSIAKDNYMRLDILKYWHKEGGLLIISYDIFRRLAQKTIPKLKKTQRDQLHTYLLDPGPDIVVCDEGHILKNEKSAISKALCLVKTQRRIVLTGTPLQNNLKEYHCMLSFVKPNLLGTSNEFQNRFVNPIMNGQYEDSNEFDVRRMKKRIHILHKLVEGCVQRCDYCALTKFLLPKHEFILSVKLSEVQINMYRWYIENLSKARGESKIQGSTLFQDYNILRNICAHPRIAQISSDRAEERRLEKELEKDEDEYEADFINDESTGSSKSDSSSEGEEVVKEYKTRSRRRSKSGSIESLNKDEPPKEMWYDKFINEENANNLELSGKMVLLMNIFKECEAIGDKIIVFSQSLLTLDCVEDMLEQDDKNNEDVTWIRNLDYFRMDGSTSADFRKAYIDSFNNPNNIRARLFLVSTRAGGLGTNLVGANRVVILDASWNPSHDVQAIFRVYRFGQKKPVYIYRLLAQGTMEEKVYDRQVSKQSLSIRVVDEQQIDRHFNSTELAELYTFDPDSMKNRPTPNFPKDRLLAEMLVKYKDLIVSYHEHDSLLQNETETDLTEEERKTAWAEFENEKEGQGNISVDDEITKYCKDPDFNEADYNTPAVSAARFIIDDLLSKTRKQCEGKDIPFMRKTLLHSIRRVKNYIQEKHVMTLRMKQEFLSKGSVPATVQKYLDELSVCLTHLNQHYTKVNEMVQADEKQMAENFKKAYIQQQANLRAAHLAANMQSNARPTFIFPQGMPSSGIRLFPPGFTLPNVRMPNQQPQQTYTQQPNQNYSNRTQRTVYTKPIVPIPKPTQVSQPVITDPAEDGNEEVIEVNDTPTSTTSSVVIEEIVD